MATLATRYNLTDFNNITFDGFDFNLPEETVKIISELALQVGSPTYVKTPVFQKRENPLKSAVPLINNKKKKGKPMESTDEDWETLRTFQPTKIEHKTGIDAHIDTIRSHLNKMSEKNYIDYRNKIIELIDQTITENINEEDFMRVGTIIFEIASNNRFFSKMYADLYCDLITKYTSIRNVFDNSFNKFAELFDNIEYVDPSLDYDKFCKNNINNEKRKALSSFFINLMINGIITKHMIIKLLQNLLSQVYKNISCENKTNEVQELTENVALLYKSDFNYDNEEYLIEGMTIPQLIEKLARSKPKTYVGLNNKSIFKFMDIIGI
jgi:hypothetical protein